MIGVLVLSNLMKVASEDRREQLTSVSILASSFPATTTYGELAQLPASIRPVLVCRTVQSKVISQVNASRQ